MVSFFNLILDTLAPSGVTLSINGDAQYTTTEKEVIPPKESTTFIKVNINDTYSKNIKLSTLDNYKVNINNTRKCNIVPDKHASFKVGIEPNIYNKRLNVKTTTNEELLISNNIYENVSLDTDDNYEVNISSTNNVNLEFPSVTKLNINIK